MPILFTMVLLMPLLLMEASDKKLNPTEKAFGEAFVARKEDQPSKPLTERSVEDLRQGVQVFLEYAGSPAAVVYRDEKIPVRDGSSIAVRIFNHQLAEAPVLIFYPGCGYVFDLFEVNSIICSRIAQFSGVKVILAQFRLAPENPLPISIQDGYDVAQYVVAHAGQFGIDPKKIVLGGWCSGAHCAAAVSSLASKHQDFEIAHQILISGCFDFLAQANDFEAFEKEDKMLSRKSLAYIAGQYYGISQQAYSDLAPAFSGLPTTTVVCGEFDALRNDSEEYCNKLSSQGVSVDKIVLPGQTHNTIALRKVLTDGEDPAAVIARVIKNRLVN